MVRLTVRILSGLFVILLITVASPPLVVAQGNSNKDKPNKEKKEHPQKNDQSAPAVEFKIEFNAKDAHRWATEYGLAGQKPLPPGIRKNLARGKPLPPGIAKRDLSSPFMSKLPTHPDYSWQMAGTDLVLVSKSDKVVRELVRDVFK